MSVMACHLPYIISVTRRTNIRPSRESSSSEIQKLRLQVIYMCREKFLMSRCWSHYIFRWIDNSKTCIIVYVYIYSDNSKTCIIVYVYISCILSLVVGRSKLVQGTSEDDLSLWQ